MTKKIKKVDVEGSNPPVKIGDRIILIAGNNSNNMYNGMAGVVNYISNNTGINANFNVRFDNGATVSIYQSRGSGYTEDVYVLETRERKAELIKKKLERMTEEIQSLKKEYDVLVKYKTDEEAVAAKLVDILETNDKKISKADKVKQIADILTNNKSNLI